MLSKHKTLLLTAATFILTATVFAVIYGMDRGIEKVISDYTASMEAMDLEQIEKTMDEDVVVYEGLYKNTGWADYRDDHLGPHIKEWRRYSVLNPKLVKGFVSGDFGYAVQESQFSFDIGTNRAIASQVATLLLRKGPDGWKIIHLHMAHKLIRSFVWNDAASNGAEPKQSPQ